MNPGHGLSKDAVDRIVAVLSGFPSVEKTILFGSRAKGTYKPGSDIDLALVGQQGLDWTVVGKIDDALDDLMLPYRFSLVVYDNSTDPEVAEHIKRVGVSLFERGQLKKKA
jgi:predicted nucleotidyltransferase